MIDQLPIEDYYDAKPKMLIGMSHIHLVRPIEIINMSEYFTAHRTKLGWIIFGSNESSSKSHVYHIKQDDDSLSEIHNLITDDFSIDNFGVKLLKPIQSAADIRAEKILNDTRKKIENQY